jgi:hypothetical protein
VDLVRRDVVEEHQRLGAAGEHVVDAVRGEVGAAVAEAATGAREYELRADTVGRRGEEPLAVQRVEAGERAEPARTGRLDRGAQPLDNGAGGGQRDSCGGVAVLRGQSGSVRRASATSRTARRRAQAGLRGRRPGT